MDRSNREDSIRRSRWFLLGAATPVGALAVAAVVLASLRFEDGTARPSISEVEEQVARERRIQSALLEALVRRAEVELADDERATLDLLLLSGGAQYGAFTAGILEGWAVSEELPRPHFDLVTGVSAGAMLATSALLDRAEVYGADSIQELFVRARDAWSLEQPIAYLPWRSSLLDPAPLRRAIEESTPPEVIDYVAREAREGRRLLIMTTDLEIGRPTVWDLTTLAARDAVERDSAYRRRILASASVPPLFPPVAIEGSLHVDGGASHVFFVGPRADLLDDLLRRLVEHGLASRTTIRVWVIVSSPIWPSVTTAPRRWPTITYRFGALGLYALTRADLQRTQRAVERVASKNQASAEFRFMSVPTDFTNENTLAGSEFVRELHDLGRRLGRRGEWSEELLPAAD